MVKTYIPERGDIVKLNFDPTLGREQAGYRPAVIITRKKFNRATRLALVCPITTQVKGFNLEILLPDSLNTKGVILAFQLKIIDWHERRVSFLEVLPKETLEELLGKLHALID
jgi:mRNA interferase MazF